jgi:hypothetical protein
MLPYLLVLLCIIGEGRVLYEGIVSFTAEDAHGDMVSPWEEHMKLIRENLPPNIFVVGYLEATDITSAGKYDEAELFMTQYGVAPVALVMGIKPEWVIGNFGNDISLHTIKNWLDQRIEGYTISNLGFGIYLIHRIKG